MGRALLGAIYLTLPIIGWIALSRSIKRVNPGEIALVNNIDGTYELLKEGLHFRPLPGDHFSESFPKSEDFINLGPVQRVRIKQGQQGVMNDNGHFKILEPGIHFIDNTKNQTFNYPDNIKDMKELDFWLGPNRVITILDGELGESYKDGQFVLLEPGRYVLPPNHVFKNKVPTATDIVDLGPPLKIVTVKQGQVAIINGPNGNEIKGPGKHYIRQGEGYFFDGLITVSAQILKLEPIVVMCSDKIEMKAEAVASAIVLLASAVDCLTPRSRMVA